MRELAIYGGVIVQLDDVDFAIECCHKWYLSSGGYVKREVKGKDTYLHVCIAKRMGLIAPIDHEDRNKLNCQQYNLRSATQHQNTQNRSTQSNNLLGITGVRYRAKLNKYQPRIKVNGKAIYLGLCNTLDEAIEIRRQAEIKYFGEFAPNR